MLHLHRSDRAEDLVGALAEVLRTPPADPFVPEVVAVPAKGVERWLVQQLSHVLGAGERRDGVCANVSFPSPARLVADAVSTASGVAPADDPWRPERLVWPLLEVIDACAGEAWCSALAGHLGLGPGGDPARRGRRLSAARHLAGLYAGYAAARPQMMRAWAGSTSSSEMGDDDGAGGLVPADLGWQAELWRRLRQRLGTPSPAERLEAACEQLRGDAAVVELPERVSVFGPTRLAVDQLAALQALSTHRDVHLWLPHPSPALWDGVRQAAGDLSSYPAGRPRRREDPARAVPRHPLLASLGQESRELQLALLGSGAGEDGGGGEAYAGHEHPGAPRPPTLLGLLQDDLVADRAPAGVPPAGGKDARALLAHDDGSVQVHACHGPARQVEVLREVVLGLLATDVTLEPRDVLVMCPDIEQYAPLVSATFGLDAGELAAGGTGEVQVPVPAHPGHRLRVRLADRSLRRTNPLLDLLAGLLDLAGGRVTASQVLDLVGTAPVRYRFRLDDEDVERMRDWVARSGVRWGLDADHRAPYGMRLVAQNTWDAGLDRILLGVGMAEDELRWVGLALPLDDVDSGDIDLAGRLAELVDRLATVLDHLAREQPLDAWVDALGEGVDALAAVPGRDTWQRSQLRDELEEVRAAAGARAHDVVLTPADLRALLADRLQGRPTRAGFRTGTLTVCSMVPMRSVPHRVVCLLGLDDGAFPRGGATDGDDILARDPCVGERDRRAEDRQLLLDALLATRQTLVVLYSGADERTNARKPPAVPVGELLDVLDATARTADGQPVTDSVVVRHPLQPFDARNYTPGGLGRPGAFSFDPSGLRAARRAAATAEPEPAPAFLLQPLAAVDEPVVELTDLVYFLEHPVRGFLRQRLGVTVTDEEDDVADALTVQLDPLAKWAVGDRILENRLAGAEPEACRAAEWRRGVLPPGPLGGRVLDTIAGDVEPLVRAAGALRTGEPATVDVVVPLSGRTSTGALLTGTLLTGTVPDVRPSGDGARTLVRVVFSRLGPKHRLRAWAQLLALAAAGTVREGCPLQAVTVGRGRGGVRRSVLTAPPQQEARELLADLVALRAEGLREPLPMAATVSHLYADYRSRRADVDAARAAAEKEWVSDFGERSDRWHQVVWGPEPELGALLAEPVVLVDAAADEATRFGSLARRLWGPLFAAEQMDAG